MIDKFICWLKGHRIEKAFYRAPIFQFYNAEKDSIKYRKVDMADDLNMIEFWCHRCFRYVRK